MRRILTIIAAGVCFSTWLFSQDPLGAKTTFIFDATVGGERGTLIRYGNWYGPGWWGGSEDPKRVGLLPPIDALDAVAQKHDFGYQVAEELGKGRPELVAYYKAMADGIAVRDSMALPEDPALWSPPPRDIAQARVYRDRIAVGFKEYVQKWNALMAWRPTKRLDPTDPDELDRILNGLLTDKQFEARALDLVRGWNKNYRYWQTEKAEKLKAANQSERVAVSADTSGAWVLEKTEFVVEKVDAAFMQKSQPTESGADGAGSAGSTFGNPARSWRMKIVWTSPPKVLVPGKEIDFKVTVSDAGSDDPKAGGFGSVGANCPALSDVWYGPAAGFDLKLGERSKAASKAYTPLKAKPGTMLYIIADYGVYSRRQQFIYTYKFTLDPGSAPAPVSTSAAPRDRPQADVDRLGHEWSVTEAVTYPGRWVRRGNSDVWDGTWNNGAVAVLSITIAGDKVRINRKDVGGPSVGTTASYEGTLAADGTIQGTETVTWPGHFTNQVQPWQGRIVK